MMLKDDPDLGSMAPEYRSIEDIDADSTLVGILKNSDLTPSLIAKNRERFTSILTKYRDKSHLLAPYPNDILRPMLNLIKDERFSENVKHNVFQYVFTVLSFMTRKKVASYLPSKANDLVSVFLMLKKQDPTAVLTSETRKLLNNFLSIVSDTMNGVAGFMNEGTITNSILELCKSYLLMKNAHWAAAVFLISNLLARSDIAENLKLYGRMLLNEAIKMNVQTKSKL